MLFLDTFCLCFFVLIRFHMLQSYRLLGISDKFISSVIKLMCLYVKEQMYIDYSLYGKRRISFVVVSIYLYKIIRCIRSPCQYYWWEQFNVGLANIVMYPNSF